MSDETDLQGNTLIGYAAVFDTPWNPLMIELQGYSETVARGAFSKALEAVNRGDVNVPLLWQHNRGQVLATTKAGTLKVAEDGKGLHVEAKLPNTSLGRDVREMITRGDVKGMSYGMETLREDSQLSRTNGIVHRTIKTIRRLVDTTLTWEPAYPATSVELRSQALALPLPELLEASELIREQRYGGYVAGLRRPLSPTDPDAYYEICLARIKDWRRGRRAKTTCPRCPR